MSRFKMMKTKTLSFKYISNVLKIVFPSFWLANYKPFFKYTCFLLQKCFLSLLYIVYAQNWNEEYEIHTHTHTHTHTRMRMHTHIHSHFLCLSHTFSVSLHIIDSPPSILSSKSKFGNTVHPINLEHGFLSQSNLDQICHKTDTGMMLGK